MTKIPDSELLEMATEFFLGPELILNGKYRWWEKYIDSPKAHGVYVKNMGSPEGEGGEDRWGIFKFGNTYCLNKNGEWQYQSSPSNRDDDFYENCRYASVHEAITYYRQWATAFTAWAELRWKEEGVENIEDGMKVVLNYEACPTIPKFPREAKKPDERAKKYKTG